MEITIKEIELLFAKVIKKLESEVDENTIEIKSNFYRLIPTEKWSEFSDKEIITGSLKDDVEELIKVIKDKTRALTYVDFDRITSLLREISQNQNPV